MIRRPPRSTLSSSSAASDVYKRQVSTQSTGDLLASMDAVFAERWSGMGASESAPHQYVFQHANGLCVVGLSRHHPACKSGVVESVNFRVELGSSKPSGKRKRGAAQLRAENVICTVQTTEGKFEAVGLVNGDLMEVNQRLAQEPGLVAEKPESDGFLAIIRPGGKQPEQIMAPLTPWSDYLVSMCAGGKQQQEQSHENPDQRAEEL
eukprot:TRINITY_DN54366_c0_g1_i1.p1 TRINITY_DN54366_c0_g1~~TRINITY_DN54366_c0_g1_i1.p1  ORF type:complete len:207 (-),score=41.28 TRINITY_DN54366_c0_g1_i1:176-796(-)